MNFSALSFDSSSLLISHKTTFTGSRIRTVTHLSAPVSFKKPIECSVVSPSSSSQVAVEQKDRVGSLSQVSGVLGSQWGDEGKGKLVDILAPHFDVVARCQVLKNHPFFRISSSLISTDFVFCFFLPFIFLGLIGIAMNCNGFFVFLTFLMESLRHDRY